MYKKLIATSKPEQKQEIPFTKMDLPATTELQIHLKTVKIQVKEGVHQ